MENISGLEINKVYKKILDEYSYDLEEEHEQELFKELIDLLKLKISKQNLFDTNLNGNPRVEEPKEAEEVVDETGEPKEAEEVVDETGESEEAEEVVDETGESEEAEEVVDETAEPEEVEVVGEIGESEETTETYNWLTNFLATNIRNSNDINWDDIDIDYF
ncbi:hypothetical protein ACVNNN_19935 [Lysinibacillus fusiformis]|uniref:hypothetical protein n=1 Tax=Lysinibacillus sp. PWR01 TaxID=3342384 RepID=UPI00372D70A8